MRARARAVLLDTLGVMLAAAPPEHASGRILAEVLAGGPAESTIVGRSGKTSAISAAFVNAALGYYWDFESLHLGAIMHGPAVALPAALAIAERQGRGGAELLAAFVAGIEVACRASLAIGPRAMYDRGFQPTAVAGVFGAAAAAGQLLGLEPARQANALGLAATQAGGLLAWSSDPSEHSKPLNTGLAARNGVTAALLAAAGFGGPRGVLDLEAEYNVFRAWSAEPRPELLVDSLGKQFALMEISFKLYPCCAFLHSALDAIRALRHQAGVQPDDVESITMRFAGSAVPLIDGTPLKTHCAQVILPKALLRGGLTLADLLDERPDPDLAALSARVRVVPDDELERLYPERYATVVELRTAGGRALARRVDVARGHFENPPTAGELEDKFLALAVPVIGETSARRLADLIGRLEELPDLRELTALLAPKGAG